MANARHHDRDRRAGVSRGPTDGQSAAGTPGFYENCRGAFSALIDLWAYTRLLLDVSRRLRAERANLGHDNRLHYVPKGGHDASPDRRRTRTEFEESVPGHLISLVKTIDGFYEADRDFRTALDVATDAVERAACELDTPSVPPLARTTIAIRRVLRDLRAAVPMPLSSAWWQVTEDGVVERIAFALDGVNHWIEELRLLVQPPHRLPPPSAAEGSAAPKSVTHGATPAQPKLTPLQVDILDALDALKAYSMDARKKATVIAKKAHGTEDEGTVKNDLAGLVRLRFVQSKAGRGGGSWVLPAGLARLREERPGAAETHPNVPD